MELGLVPEGPWPSRLGSSSEIPALWAEEQEFYDKVHLPKLEALSPNFQKSRALIWTPNRGILMLRTPT